MDHVSNTQPKVLKVALELEKKISVAFYLKIFITTTKKSDCTLPCIQIIDTLVLCLYKSESRDSIFQNAQAKHRLML